MGWLEGRLDWDAIDALPQKPVRGAQAAGSLAKACLAM
jgi:hypothetical protein